MLFHVKVGAVFGILIEFLEGLAMCLAGDVLVRFGCLLRFTLSRKQPAWVDSAEFGWRLGNLGTTPGKLNGVRW
jgi:hypothetical protein